MPGIFDVPSCLREPGKRTSTSCIPGKTGWVNKKYRKQLLGSSDRLQKKKNEIKRRYYSGWTMTRTPLQNGGMAQPVFKYYIVLLYFKKTV